MLKKQIALFIIEIDVNKLIIANDALNTKILDLTPCLEKFTQGQKNLNLLLGSQICMYDRVKIGYKTLQKYLCKSISFHDTKIHMYIMY